MKPRLYTGAAVLLVFLIWDLSTRWQWVNPFLLPAPWAVFSSFIDMIESGELLIDIWESATRVFAGFAMAALIGTPIGLLIALSDRVRWSLDPLLQFLRPIPPIAWIPLTILWFGLGNGPAYALTMIASFFPIVLNTYFGVQRIEAQHIDVARCFGASRALRLRALILPAALPSILTGWRIGFGTAWMAVMAAEMVASHTGLGYLIQVSQNMLRTDRVLVGMVSIGLVGFVLDRLFVALQSRWVRWS